MIRIHERPTASSPRTTGTSHRSIADVVRDLRDETFLLVRQEVALARVELSEKTSKAMRNVVYVMVGGAIGFAGLIFLLLAGTAGVFIGLLEGGVPTDVSLWLAPLIVGVVVGVIGYIFLQKGITTLRRGSPVPTRTVESLKEDKRWLQESMK